MEELGMFIRGFLRPILAHCQGKSYKKGDLTKGGFSSEIATRFLNLQTSKYIPKNYPELEI